ncbi:hypothetical protein GF312_13015 [Candidatus Poribacteria bacterium]|nr:hypothetical protein [Candidatus Poribacteria bacterium]
MSKVIPHLYLFDVKFKSPKRKKPVKIDGKLDEWSEKYIVPDIMNLNGSYKKTFADVYFSWDDDNLYIAYEAKKWDDVETDTKRFWRKDCMELWIDLRNDKSQRRYTEHCHHFFLLPLGKKGSPELATAGEARQPGSSIEDTIYDYEDVEVASRILRNGYRLESRIPKSVIPTYDPLNFPQLGFNYHINNTDRRSQWWSCGPDFPRHEDPSTWGTVELCEY